MVGACRDVIDAFGVHGACTRQSIKSIKGTSAESASSNHVETPHLLIGTRKFNDIVNGWISRRYVSSVNVLLPSLSRFLPLSEIEESNRDTCHSNK